MIKELIQSAKEALRQKGFTELTIRMGYCQFWNPLADYLCEAETFDSGSLSAFSLFKYGCDLMQDRIQLSKKLMRAKHAYQVPWEGFLQLFR